MDKLWAPWRLKYVQARKEKGCIFCRAARSASQKHFVVFKRSRSLCILNIFPYNNGHLMIAPLRHVGDIEDCSSQETLELMDSLVIAKRLLKRTLAPQGYNIGINIAQVAGAGIPGHLHIHIVPRWNGDTNFMPVLNNTKVISQSLEELHTQLCHAYAKTDKKIRG